LGNDLSDKPDWVFYQERSLADKCVADAIMNAGGLHDAYLSCVRSGPNELILTFDAPYFPAVCQYGQYGICKAILSLTVQPHMSSYEVVLLDGVVDMEVYQVNLLLSSSKLHLSLEPFYDLEIDIVALKSTFKWVFSSSESVS
jgi:hypothetical protein